MTRCISLGVWHTATTIKLNIFQIDCALFSRIIHATKMATSEFFFIRVPTYITHFHISILMESYYFIAFPSVRRTRNIFFFSSSLDTLRVPVVFMRQSFCAGRSRHKAKAEVQMQSYWLLLSRGRPFYSIRSRYLDIRENTLRLMFAVQRHHRWLIR